MGSEISADGLLYWGLIASFVLTNRLILQQLPHLFYWQLCGILAGATIVALSMYPQLMNWTLDYTLHSGQLWPNTSDVLATAVRQNQQPIGLYSHRGYASFTLAIASVLSLAAFQNRWFPTCITLPLLILHSVTLSLAKVRGAMLAMIASWCWLTLTGHQHRFIRVAVVTLSLIGVLSFAWTTTERHIKDAELNAKTPLEATLKHFTSDRIYLWQRGWNYFLERPWIGWGFNGYGIADAVAQCPEGTHPVGLEAHHVLCQNAFLQTTEVTIKGNKAHNMFLDWLLSVGVLGALSYFFLILVSIPASKDTRKFVLGILLCYQVYGLTWFDCAQITHIAWWILSIEENIDKPSPSAKSEA